MVPKEDPRECANTPGAWSEPLYKVRTMSTLPVSSCAVNANRRDFLASLVAPAALSVVPNCELSPVGELQAELVYHLAVIEWGPRFPDCQEGQGKESFHSRAEAYREARETHPRPKHCLDIPDRPDVIGVFADGPSEGVDRKAGLAEVAKRNRAVLMKKGNLVGEKWYVLIQVEDEGEHEILEVSLDEHGVGRQEWSSQYAFRIVHPTAGELARFA